MSLAKNCCQILTAADREQNKNNKKFCHIPKKCLEDGTWLMNTPWAGCPGDLRLT